jgi:predicted MFS family arabinose efflux permease
MSPKVFYLSFSSILLVTTLRVGYSSAKPHLKKQYNLESSFLALMDCLIVFGIAIGFMLRFHFLGSGNPIKTLRLNGLMMCFFYLCLPVIPLINS